MGYKRVVWEFFFVRFQEFSSGEYVSWTYSFLISEVKMAGQKAT